MKVVILEKNISIDMQEILFIRRLRAHNSEAHQLAPLVGSNLTTLSLYGRVTTDTHILIHYLPVTHHVRGQWEVILFFIALKYVTPVTEI